jgi:hypothetical protein
MMFLVAVDVKDFWDKSGSSARYGLLLVPIGAALLIRLRYRSTLLRRWSPPDRILFVLMAYGMAGSILGKIGGAAPSGALPVFAPMLVAFVYLLTVSNPTEEEAWRLLRGLAFVGLVYAFFNALANAGASFITPKTYRNSKVLYIAMGIAAAISARRRKVLLALVLLAGFIFATYPSGTDAVVFVTGVATWFITKPRGSPLRPAVTIGLGLLVFVFAVANFSATTGLAAEYFHAVGKKNNNNARIALYTAALHSIAQSPVYGTGFTGSITESVIRQAGNGAPFKAPFHDDYLMMTAVGGGVALLLFLIWLAATETNVLRRYRGFLISGQPAKAMLLRSLLIGFNTMFVAALFNPELEAIGRGATVFGIYALMMMLGEPMIRSMPRRAVRRMASRHRPGLSAPVTV